MIQHPDIFLPVVIPNDRHSRQCFSVNVNLPKELSEEYERYAKETTPELPFIDVHGALYLYRASEWTQDQLRQELEEKLLEGLNSGPGTVLDENFRENFKREAAVRQAKRRELEEAGQIGNLSLPEELYNFVVTKIQDGTHKTPTEVVMAALPYLRAENEKRQRSV